MSYREDSSHQFSKEDMNSIEQYGTFDSSNATKILCSPLPTSKSYPFAYLNSTTVNPPSHSLNERNKLNGRLSTDPHHSNVGISSSTFVSSDSFDYSGNNTKSVDNISCTSPNSIVQAMARDSKYTRLSPSLAELSPKTESALLSIETSNKMETDDDDLRDNGGSNNGTRAENAGESEITSLVMPSPSRNTNSNRSSTSSYSSDVNCSIEEPGSTSQIALSETNGKSSFKFAIGTNENQHSEKDSEQHDIKNIFGADSDDEEREREGFQQFYEKTKKSQEENQQKKKQKEAQKNEVKISIVKREKPSIQDQNTRDQNHHQSTSLEDSSISASLNPEPPNQNNTLTSKSLQNCPDTVKSVKKEENQVVKENGTTNGTSNCEEKSKNHKESHKKDSSSVKDGRTTQITTESSKQKNVKQQSESRSRHDTAHSSRSHGANSSTTSRSSSREKNRESKSESERRRRRSDDRHSRYSRYSPDNYRRSSYDSDPRKSKSEIESHGKYHRRVGSNSRSRSRSRGPDSRKYDRRGRSKDRSKDRGHHKETREREISWERREKESGRERHREKRYEEEQNRRRREKSKEERDVYNSTTTNSNRQRDERNSSGREKNRKSSSNADDLERDRIESIKKSEKGSSHDSKEKEDHPKSGERKESKDVSLSSTKPSSTITKEREEKKPVDKRQRSLSPVKGDERDAKRSKTESSKAHQVGVSDKPNESRHQVSEKPKSTQEIYQEGGASKRYADELFKTDARKAIKEYFKAGLKFLECAPHMPKPEDFYQQTGSLFRFVTDIAMKQKLKEYAALGYLGSAFAFFRAFHLKKNRIKTNLRPVHEYFRSEVSKHNSHHHQNHQTTNSNSSHHHRQQPHQTQASNSSPPNTSSSPSYNIATRGTPSPVQHTSNSISHFDCPLSMGKLASELLNEMNIIINVFEFLHSCDEHLPEKYGKSPMHQNLYSFDPEKLLDYIRLSLREIEKE